MIKAKTLPVLVAPRAKSTTTDVLGGTVFVDGPNIDMTLSDILGRKPEGKDRPCWKATFDFCRRTLGRVHAEFVFNGRHFDNSNVFALYRALRYIGWNPKAPRDDTDDPVDTYIRSALKQFARTHSSAHVVLFSHDHGYAPYLAAVLK